MSRPLEMVGPARAETFDEAGYLEANPDVAAAVSAGHFESGRQHFERFGVGERRLMALIEENAEGLLLDCGAGSRPVYFDNVVNYEIVDYLTTDVIGVGERLPFKSDVFDGVISIAVLEHVRDPFGCAAELVRVLKPGGRLVCCVPFLQPEHGYPHALEAHKPRRHG